jgi:methionyl-tRNA synthetase
MRARNILHICAQVAANAGVLLGPFLPRTAKKIARAFGAAELGWFDAGANIVGAGTILGDLPILFEKVDDETMEAQREKLGPGPVVAAEIEAAKPEITFEAFTGMDLRVGTVLTCESVAKAKKLLKLSVDVGMDTRTIVSGIAEHFSPEDVVGRRVLVLVNLAPRKIRGVESQGMVLMADAADGGLRFLTPEEGAIPGAVVR